MSERTPAIDPNVTPAPAPSAGDDHDPRAQACGEALLALARLLGRQAAHELLAGGGRHAD